MPSYTYKCKFCGYLYSETRLSTQPQHFTGCAALAPFGGVVTGCTKPDGFELLEQK